MDKTQLFQTIKDLGDISNEYNLNHVSVKLDKIEDELNSDKVIIPLIGRFSSGKSSMINALIGQDIFKVGIKATSAIKQVIRRGENRAKIEKDGAKEEISIEEFREIPANDFGDKIMSAEILVDSENLPQNLILLDLPGLESGYKKHDEVIEEVMSDLHSLIVTVSVDEGSLRKSVLKFLSEFNVFNRKIYLLITMADSSTSEKAKEVKEYCENQLTKIGVQLIGSYLTSANKNNTDIEGFKKILIDISENSNEFIFAKIKFDLLNCTEILESGLVNIKENSNSSVSELQSNIKKITDSKYELEKELNSEISKFKINLRKSVPEIARKMGNYFESNVEELANACMVNEENFKYSYNSILGKAIDLVLLPSIEEVLSENISSFEDSVKNIKVQIPNLDTKFIDNIKSLISGLTMLIKTEKLIKFIKKIKLAKKITKIPKGVIDIALIIIQDWAINKLSKMYITNELLKSFRISLVNQLESEILIIVNEISSGIENKFKEEYQVRFDTIEDSLNNLINQIDKKKSDFKEYIENLDTNINKVKEFEKNLK